MMGRTHVLLGLDTLWLLEVTPLSVLFDLDSNRLVLCLLAAATGALLPDLDASASLLQNLSVGGMRPFVPAARLLHASLGHRGALHSFLGLGVVAALALPLAALDPLAWMCLLLGYTSHLAGDACTRSGVPLLFPRRQSLHFLPRSLRLSTGSNAEEAWFAVFAVAAVSLLLRHLFLLSLVLRPL